MYLTLANPTRTTLLLRLFVSFRRFWTIIMFLGTLDRVRKAGLTAPSSTTVNRHKVFGRVGEGWSKDVIDGLQAAMKAANVPVHAKYGVVSFDEVKCKEGLAFDPHSLELIGWLLN